MKKIICILLTLLMIGALAGCGADKNKEDNLSVDVTKTSGIKENKEDNSGIDVDLTKLSSTMVYSEVYNMMMKPDDYLGKIVKMKGQFSIFQETDSKGMPINDKIYFACIIADATACCQQGMEFVLEGDKKYPEDYPDLDSEITVVGEFQTYMEDMSKYCHLINAKIID